MTITKSNFVIKKKGVLKDDPFQVSNTLCTPLLSVIAVSWVKEGNKCMCSVSHSELEA